MDSTGASRVFSTSDTGIRRDLDTTDSVCLTPIIEEALSVVIQDGVDLMLKGGNSSDLKGKPLEEEGTLGSTGRSKRCLHVSIKELLRISIAVFLLSFVLWLQGRLQLSSTS